MLADRILTNETGHSTQNFTAHRMSLLPGRSDTCQNTTDLSLFCLFVLFCLFSFVQLCFFFFFCFVWRLQKKDLLLFLFPFSFLRVLTLKAAKAGGAGKWKKNRNFFRCGIQLTATLPRRCRLHHKFQPTLVPYSLATSCISCSPPMWGCCWEQEKETKRNEKKEKTANFWFIQVIVIIPKYKCSG